MKELKIYMSKEEMLQDQLTETTDLLKRAIETLKLVHKKHFQGDESIGWQEVDESVYCILADCMGDAEYRKWLNNEP